MRPRRARQLGFEYQGRSFKVKYNHTVGSRGGIDVVEVLPGRGEPEGGTVLEITNLAEAEDAYNNLEDRLAAFCNSN